MSNIEIKRADDKVASFQKEEEIEKFDNIELTSYEDDDKVVLWLDKEDYEKIKEVAKELGW